MSETSQEVSPPVDAVASGVGEIALPPQFDLRTCGDVAELLSARAGHVEVRADAVEVMTSPGLQVLLAAVRDGSRVLNFVAPSKAFLDCMTLLGCHPSDFADPLEVAA